VVGDRERIDSEVADALVAQLYGAGLALHKALALPLDPDGRDLVESALDKLDEAIRVVGLAALGLDPSGEPGSPV